MHFRFDNTYASLPSEFFAPAAPSPVKNPQLIAFNESLAEDLGIDCEQADTDSIARICSGNVVPEGAHPLAMAYSGHQFGGFSPQLGDGRAILLGEVIDKSGNRRDIQWKGAGPTPFSRRGDGRSALGPVLREYVVSEAMHALGIPTTRALAAVSTGENVYRETVEPGGVFTRVAQSHLRIGTVQFFAARQDIENLKVLVKYALKRHYPEAIDSGNPALALLNGVMNRQANLVAKWMNAGFIHGVMNTDNMSLSGETIDYGPCAFMDHYDPARKFSFIDRGGRYAFANQPAIAHWNLTRLAEALLPLLDEKEEQAIELAEAELSKFPSLFEPLYMETFCRKIGLPRSSEDSWALADSFLDLLRDRKVDFTLAYRRLTEVLEAGSNGLLELFSDPEPVSRWLDDWKQTLGKLHIPNKQAIQLMREANPVYIPRNHKIEELIEAGKEGDFSLFHRMNEVVAKPFESREEFSEYELAPEPHEVVPATFCGT